MTEPDMIERLSTALEEFSIGHLDPETYYTRAVLTLLLVLREPTPGMVAAVANRHQHGHPIAGEIIADWQTMIDQVFRGGPPHPVRDTSKEER